MELQVIDPQENLMSCTVSDYVFDTPYNEPLIHQVVVAYQKNGRQGSKAQKTRAQVRGGGKKPWKQKGTGRARAGSSSSPIWVGGGVTFAASPRKYVSKVNKKMYRLAMRSIFSELFRKNTACVIQDFELETHKTKEFIQRLTQYKIDTRAVVICGSPSELLLTASQNHSQVAVCSVNDIDPVLLLAFPKIVLTQCAVKKIEEWLS